MLSVPGWRYGSTNVGGLEFLGVAGINYLIILSNCRITVFGIGDHKPARLGPATPTTEPDINESTKMTIVKVRRMGFVLGAEL
jgi:hypothetical protein